MPLNRALIQELRAKRAESDRLMAVLDFYAWLEEHGTSWDQIKGVRPLDNTPRSRSEFKASCRRHGTLETIWEKYNTAWMVEASNGLHWKWIEVNPGTYEGDETPVLRPKAYAGRFLDILLKDGRQLVLPWPPFSENVVYNRS